MGIISPVIGTTTNQESAPVPYGNIYKVWCIGCRRTVKIVNPKTLHRPRCPKCDCTCRLPHETPRSRVNYRI